MKNLGCLPSLILIPLGIVLGLTVSPWCYVLTAIGVPLIFLGVSVNSDEATRVHIDWEMDQSERETLLAQFDSAMSGDVDKAPDYHAIYTYIGYEPEPFVPSFYRSMVNDLSRSHPKSTVGDVYAAHELIKLDMHASALGQIWKEIHVPFKSQSREELLAILEKKLARWKHESISLNENYERITLLTACKEMRKPDALPTELEQGTDLKEAWFDRLDRLIPFDEFECKLFQGMFEELVTTFESIRESDNRDYLNCLDTIIDTLENEESATTLRDIWQSHG